jgi:hypothetical protein
VARRLGGVRVTGCEGGGGEMGKVGVAAAMRRQVVDVSSMEYKLPNATQNPKMHLHSFSRM